MKSDSEQRFVDICISDNEPCSCSVKGVGIGLCIKRRGDTVVVCPRFSDVSLLERSLCEKNEV